MERSFRRGAAVAAPARCSSAMACTRGTVSRRSLEKSRSGRKQPNSVSTPMLETDSQQAKRHRDYHQCYVPASSCFLYSSRQCFSWILCYPTCVGVSVRVRLALRRSFSDLIVHWFGGSFLDERMIDRFSRGLWQSKLVMIRDLCAVSCRINALKNI